MAVSERVVAVWRSIFNHPSFAVVREGGKVNTATDFTFWVTRRGGGAKAAVIKAGVQDQGLLRLIQNEFPSIQACARAIDESIIGNKSAEPELSKEEGDDKPYGKPILPAFAEVLGESKAALISGYLSLFVQAGIWTDKQLLDRIRQNSDDLNATMQKLGLSVPDQVQGFIEEQKQTGQSFLKIFGEALAMTRQLMVKPELPVLPRHRLGEVHKGLPQPSPPAPPPAPAPVASPASASSPLPFPAGEPESVPSLPIPVTVQAEALVGDSVVAGPVGNNFDITPILPVIKSLWAGAYSQHFRDKGVNTNADIVRVLRRYPRDIVAGAKALGFSGDGIKMNANLAHLCRRVETWTDEELDLHLPPRSGFGGGIIRGGKEAGAKPETVSVVPPLSPAVTDEAVSEVMEDGGAVNDLGLDSPEVKLFLEAAVWRGEFAQLLLRLDREPELREAVFAQDGKHCPMNMDLRRLLAAWRGKQD